MENDLHDDEPTEDDSFSELAFEAAVPISFSFFAYGHDSFWYEPSGTPTSVLRGTTHAQTSLADALIELAEPDESDVDYAFDMLRQGTVVFFLVGKPPRDAPLTPGDLTSIQYVIDPWNGSATKIYAAGPSQPLTVASVLAAQRVGYLPATGELHFAVSLPIGGDTGAFSVPEVWAVIREAIQSPFISWIVEDGLRAACRAAFGGFRSGRRLRDVRRQADHWKAHGFATSYALQEYIDEYAPWRLTLLSTRLHMREADAARLLRNLGYVESPPSKFAPGDGFNARRLRKRWNRSLELD